MRIISALLAISTFAHGVFGVFPITGSPTGGTAPRYEVRELHNYHKAQWNLFLLALQDLQALPQSEQLSWLGIAGIHGVPCASWDGVQKSGNGCGWCVHQSNLFTSWHRPYVTLMEMRLANSAREIAARYPANIRAQYVAAANTLRLPFFDWALRPGGGNPAWPTIFSATTASVLTPTGQKTIANPLFNYRFHPNPQFFGGVFNEYPTTMRYPTAGGASAHSQNNLVAATFARNNAGIRSSVFNFFSNCPAYLDLANMNTKPVTQGCPTVLEQIHNNIHGEIGGGPPYGHMTVVPNSAFDPTFWLHHCNVDRLYAMWQALHPGVGCPPQRQPVGTFGIQSGSTGTSATPLKPFHSNANGAFWTTASQSNFRVFRYTYPDFNGGSSPDAIRRRIATLYGPSGAASKVKRQDDSPLTASNGTLFEYIAEITTTKYQLGGSYPVYVFIDEPTTDDPQGWSYDPNLAGYLTVFADSDTSLPGSTISGIVTLTPALTEKVEAGEIPSLSQDVITPYLSEKLVWKVVNPSGASVDPDDVPDFFIKVVATTIDLSGNPSEVPIFSPPDTLANVTSGQPGGIGSANDPEMHPSRMFM